MRRVLWIIVPLGAVVPAMSQENVTKFNAYLDGIKGMQTDSANLVPGLAQALNMTPEHVQQFLAFFRHDPHPL